MNVVVFDSLRSTQDRALEYARAGRRDVDAVRAVRQTAGRGRKAQDWHSPPGSLAVSYILWDVPVPERRWVLGMAMAAAVGSALEDLGCRPVMLKWSNDVLVNGRKVAGVLTQVTGEAVELVGRKSPASHQAPTADPVAVIGVGVNVNTGSFPPGLWDRATSVRAVTGVDHDIERLAEDIWQRFTATGLDPAGIVRAFRERDGTTGRAFRGPNGLRGVALGITDEGLLTVRWGDGSTGTLPSAEPDSN